MFNLKNKKKKKIVLFLVKYFLHLTLKFIGNHIIYMI